MSRFIQWAVNMKLQNKLIVLFLLLCFIPLTMLGTFSYYRSSEVIQQKVYQTVLENLSQVNYGLNYFMSDIEQLSMYIYSNQDIQDVLAKPEERSLLEKHEDSKTISNVLDAFLGFKSWDIQIYLLGLNGDRYFTGDLLPTAYSSFNPNWGLFRKAGLADGNIAWDTQYTIKKTDDYGAVISLGRLIKNIETNEPLGYLVIDVMEPALADKYNKAQVYPGGQVLLLDRGGYIVSSTPSKQEVGTRLEDGFLSSVLGGTKGYFRWNDPNGVQFMVVYDTSETTGFKMVNKIPVAAITKDSQSIRNLTLIVIALEVIVFFIIAFLLSRTLTRPIRKLKALMSRVEEGNLNVTFPARSEDEIGQLGQSFNNMLRQIKLLINEVYEKQLRVQEAELKAVHAQFNPHFLYNALDSINWMARIHKLDDISRTAVSLGELLRFSISKDGVFIRVEEDIRQIQNYLNIQQMRYRDKFSVSIDIQPEIKRLYTLKLLLQPVIENAVTHGLEMKLGQGKLMIQGMLIGDKIRFTIEDDGIGMDIRTVEQILRGEYHSVHHKNTGIGLENVRKRLMLYFKEHSSFRVESAPGVGTKVIIELPVIEEVKEGESNVSYHHS
ncbi:cache domain-containing sensor histidine kinase [Paenibacillus senegalensis]|uniref:cache domain-containing sensor histidine kinase n=1 Tax=Paenibacillus senegalensis TaxID=1465766 RepID=UPI00030119F8|nr:sensor histidine kinase [Paenibacillus senegalensis]